jgi:hypothetical protein
VPHLENGSIWGYQSQGDAGKPSVEWLKPRNQQKMLILAVFYLVNLGTINA